MNAEHRISTLSPSEFERWYGVKLAPVDNQGLPVKLVADIAHISRDLSKLLLQDRPEELKQLSLPIDKREADAILDVMRQNLGADVVVGVTYSDPYCRKVDNNTIIAQGFAAKIVSAPDNFIPY